MIYDASLVREISSQIQNVHQCSQEGDRRQEYEHGQGKNLGAIRVESFLFL